MHIVYIHLFIQLFQYTLLSLEGIILQDNSAGGQRFGLEPISIATTNQCLGVSSLIFLSSSSVVITDGFSLFMK